MTYYLIIRRTSDEKDIGNIGRFPRLHFGSIHLLGILVCRIKLGDIYRYSDSDLCIYPLFGKGSYYTEING